MGLGDVGTRGRGTRGLGTRRRGYSETWDSETWDSETWDSEKWVLGDVINKQYLIFALNLESTIFGGLEKAIICWRAC